tara:strand:- start:6211 stop:6687 length:477 start_codon:yes stop_codon:yes gene_type:complete
MFGIPFVMFFGAPIVVPFLGLTAGEAAALIGGVIVAAELIWFASIPLLGLKGFKAMKKKAFGFLKIPEGPGSAVQHKWGVRLFWVGLGTQLALHIVLVFAYILVGAHPDRIILGMDFEQQTMAFFSILIIAIISLVLGVYLLGEVFLGKMKAAFRQED